ncbi:MAG: ATP synthase F1 subunit delta [Chloroflexi bacterium]|nr:ATP synthase F1 subunit delta [Chloroflexota bacterium]
MRRRASARRYAQAVFDIASERGELDQWQETLKDMVGAAQDSLLVAALESARVSFSDKEAILRRRFEGAPPLAINLALLLTIKRRWDAVPDIAEEYGRLRDAQGGMEHGEVVTAIPLKKDEMERLAQRLTEMVGKKVILTSRVDPQIIAGFVARIGDRLINGSVRERFQTLKRRLAGVE